ncbi:hypothetical protein BJF90_00835 [Pseudonocardia sp. CNS-004]|nr:hypothetical protein BJF90_00835 [Pseudonocardia sp. CNS-004]
MSGPAFGILTDLVRTALGLPPEAAVTVSQLTCREPGCLPVEPRRPAGGCGACPSDHLPGVAFRLA